MAPRSLDIASIHTLLRHLGRTRPDVVHAHASLSARIAARLRRIPARLYTRHGSSSRQTAQWRQGGTGAEQRGAGLRGTAERWLSDDAVAVSRSIGEELVAEGIPPARIHVIPSGIEPAPYRQAAARRREWRAKLGVAEGDLVVVGTGRLAREKAWDTWLGVAADAMHIAKSTQAGGEMHSPRFFIAGEGPERATLTRVCHDSGLPPETLLGFIEDIPGLLAASDVFMLLSHTEAMSLALLEAMHSGLPVITTNVGGSPEIVRDGDTGYLVEVEDVAAAVGALRRLLGDSAQRVAMGRLGLVVAEAEFSARRMAEDVRSLYASLLAGRTA